MNDIDQKLHEQFANFGRNAKEWMRKCVLLLPEIERRAVWRKKKFGSLYEYAAKLAGMSRNTVDEALRVLKKIEDKPVLQAVVAAYGLQRVRPVVAVATVENQNFWAEKARSMSKNTLEMYVRNYRSEVLPREEIQSVKITMNLHPQLAAKLQKLKGDRSWNQFVEKLLEESFQSQQKPVPVENASRSIPVRIKKFVTQKTNHHCAYPTCIRYATSLHHTKRFKLYRTHDPDHIFPVCTAHERIAHLGLIEREEQSPEQWRLRTLPDQHHEKYYIDTLVQRYRSSA